MYNMSVLNYKILSNCTVMPRERAFKFIQINNTTYILWSPCVDSKKLSYWLYFNCSHVYPWRTIWNAINIFYCIVYLHHIQTWNCICSSDMYNISTRRFGRWVNYITVYLMKEADWKGQSERWEAGVNSFVRVRLYLVLRMYTLWPV